MASIAHSATIRPSSSHSMPNTMSVLAAKIFFSQPQPAPCPNRPPEATALSARVCWKPAPETSSHTCPQVAKRCATCGLMLSTSVPAMAADATASSTVAMLPERMKAMTRNVAKKMSAEPKSPISASPPTQMAEKAMNSRMLLLRNIRLSDVAPT